MIKHLHEKGIYTLHQINDTKATIVWKKGWKSTQFINFHGERMDNWLIQYLNEMEGVHIRIRDLDESLMWAKNKVTCIFTAKLGYESLMDHIG